jgi:hypothetical protein
MSDGFNRAEGGRALNGGDPRASVGRRPFKAQANGWSWRAPAYRAHA